MKRGFPQPVSRDLNQPLSAYAQRRIMDFTVLIHRQVLAHSTEMAEALQELEKQIRQIIRAVPPEPLRELRRVRIWLEWENNPRGAAEYHPSAEWLREHGYNPEKAGNVEINNARNFVQWSRGEQPWMLLHELAHAYHHQVLGYENRMVLIAYRHAMQRGLYEQVEYIRGGKQKAYATTNVQEYFAELSEAYFGKNDFYPFTREELARHDPVGYKMIERAWQV
ncbi:MAG: hypothetical protein KatS3mg023_3545 [Armatimonadota bacterium]|nr:MAG: hypothetical protein KatS3mg023_3545 [Armatimonadota bacterium]